MYTDKLKEYNLFEIDESAIKRTNEVFNNRKQAAPDLPLTSINIEGAFCMSCDVSTYKTPDYVVIYDDKDEESKYDSFRYEFMSDLNRYGRTPIENQIFDVSSPDFKLDGIGNGFIIFWYQKIGDTIFYMKDLDNIYEPFFFHHCSDKYIVAGYKKLILIISLYPAYLTKLKGKCKYYTDFLLVFPDNIENSNTYPTLSLISINDMKEFKLSALLDKLNIKSIDFTQTLFDANDKSLIVYDIDKKNKIKILLSDIEKKCDSFSLPQNDISMFLPEEEYCIGAMVNDIVETIE